MSYNRVGADPQPGMPHCRRVCPSLASNHVAAARSGDRRSAQERYNEHAGRCETNCQDTGFRTACHILHFLGLDPEPHQRFKVSRTEARPEVKVAAAPAGVRGKRQSLRALEPACPLPPFGQRQGAMNIFSSADRHCAHLPSLSFFSSSSVHSPFFAARYATAIEAPAAIAAWYAAF